MHVEIRLLKCVQIKFEWPIFIEISILVIFMQVMWHAYLIYNAFLYMSLCNFIFDMFLVCKGRQLAVIVFFIAHV